jgi:hypothetical protein
VLYPKFSAATARSVTLPHGAPTVDDSVVGSV